MCKVHIQAALSRQIAVATWGVCTATPLVCKADQFFPFIPPNNINVMTGRRSIEVEWNIFCRVIFMFQNPPPPPRMVSVEVRFTSRAARVLRIYYYQWNLRKQHGLIWKQVAVFASRKSVDQVLNIKTVHAVVMVKKSTLYRTFGHSSHRDLRGFIPRMEKTCWNLLQNTFASLHYTFGSPNHTLVHQITLCLTTLHFASLHYTLPHHITLCFTTLHLCFTALHFASPHYTLLHCITVCFTKSHFASLHYTLLHQITLCFTALHLCFTTLHFASPHYTLLHYITPLLHCITLCFTTLHFASLHYSLLHQITLCFTALQFASPNHTLLHYITLCFTKSHFASPHYTFASLHYTLPHHITLCLLSSDFFHQHSPKLSGVV